MNSAEGDVDRAFWQSFHKLQSASGGPYVTGWINVLFPYLEIMDVHQNRRAPMPNPAMARWIEGMRKDHGGPATHAATGAVRPSIGWAIGEARDLHAERARREEEEREKRLRAERDCVRIQPAGKRLRIVLGGQTIVDTGRVLAVLEEGRPPRYYVPREDVQASLAEGPGRRDVPVEGDLAFPRRDRRRRDGRGRCLELRQPDAEVSGAPRPRGVLSRENGRLHARLRAVHAPVR